MVWSDPEIKKLSTEFVTVADEAYYLYPENPEHLERARGRPEHEFFRKYGEAMPPGAWNKGTKQGIYMIGPNSEYLEGRFAASGEPDDIRARLNRALQRWNALKQEKGYANKAVPAKAWAPPAGIEGELVFRVNLRDLPRGPGDKSGARRHEIPATGMWMDFTKWAWNENWIGVPRAAAFVPSGDGPQEVDLQVVQRIAREVLVDNVRGQTPAWRPEEVKRTSLVMRRLGGGKIEYTGSFLMEAGARGFEAKLYGRGMWTGSKFTSLDIVVMGTRRGAGSFNQRERDPGPAPMGITLSLSKQ